MQKRHYLPLFVAIFLLAVLNVLLSGSAAAQTQPTLTPLPTFTVLPTLGPTAINTPTPAGCVVPLPLVKGSIIFIRGGVNIRHQPSVSGGVVGYTAEQTEYVVVGGPVCANDLNWWQVSGPGNDGWVAEGKPGNYLIINSGITTTDATPQGCGVPLQLVKGETLLLFTGLRVRAQPNLEGLVLTVASDGSRAVVLDGPICADRYNWWKVRVQVLDIVYEGWIVEGTKQTTQTYIISETELYKPVCDFPLNLGPGDRARVNYFDFKEKHLRTAPSLSAPILFDLIDEVPLIIIGGPVCADGYNWWNVTVRSNIAATGWMAEGGRWIRLVEKAPTLTPLPTATQPIFAFPSVTPIFSPTPTIIVIP
jgi:hypothetical protein